MRLVERSIRRPVTVFIFALAAVVFGLVALSRLATDLLPDITYPSLTVRTGYDGAAPAEIETLVTRPVENAVGVVNGVVRVTSSSRADTSEVTLEFSWGTNMDLAGLDVRERLDVLELPPEAERSVLLRYDPSLDPIVRVGLTGGSDLVRLRRLAEEEVQRAIERIEGVAGVVVSGGLEEELQVELDERQLANLGLQEDLVRRRLAEENVNLTGGRLLEGRSEYLVRTVRELERPEDLEAIVLESRDGALVRLGDVARVVRGHKEREVITRIDGREAVEVAVYKEGGTNTVAVSDAVRKGLDDLGSRLQAIDPALRVVIVTDQARYIRDSVSEVLKTAVIGGALAILVLFFFLENWATTSIIGVAIPLSVVATFFMMFVGGISLNIMSLGGLTLGIGLLVDNSIVVLEAVQRRRDLGLPPAQAAAEGASEVSRAVVASTLTTICVFLPIVFVQGVAGQLFGDQALTVTFSLLVSLVVALTVIPMLAARGGSAAEAGACAAAAQAGRRGLALGSAVGLARAVRLAGRGLDRASRWLLALPLRLFRRGLELLRASYLRLLGRALDRPWAPVAIALLLLALSLLLVPTLGRELVPELVQGEFFVDLELPPGTHLEVTQARLAGLERAARGLPGVREVYAVAGTSALQGGVAGELRANLAQLTVLVESPSSRAEEDALIAALREELDRDGEIEYRFGRPSYFSFRTPIELEIRGYNLAQLRRLGDQAVRALTGIEGLTDVEASTEGGNPELQVVFDRERLASLGLSLANVASTLRAKIQGVVATDVQRQDRTVDIRVRAQERYRDSAEDLGALTVAQNGKTAIPLSAVARIERTVGPAEIRRSEGERVAVVTANLTAGDLASAADAIDEAMAGISFPAGFSWRLTGQQQEMQTSFASMRMAILLAVFLVYLVMASQFESLLHPLVILFSIPFAAVGVVAVLAALSITVSIVVLIGVILLAGIVVNNAILLVDHANRRRRDGLPKREALLEAGGVRLRPILMTTSTTVLGLLPMALGWGDGSELRAPMAWTVVGGLLASTALTLVVIPAVYLLLDRRP
ncbi:MAG: efflux RND transporter permease subunit [Thermoanaerobaculia bacterium]